MIIVVSIPEQTLRLLADDDSELACYSISTAARGAGEVANSYCTPRGRHHIRLKIGGDQPPLAVFVRRRPTGEIWSPELAAAHPGRDWILSRILWLTGDEPGCNRGRNAAGECVDTLRRYIYIHGTAPDAPLGIPLSHGCIRMNNDDLLDLFDRVEPGTSVDITA
jgi:hypothetical protein